MPDVVIIGAGVVGLAAAYEADRLGLRVSIVDADYPGSATDAGAGIVNPLDLIGEQSVAERQRVALGGSAYYRDLLDRLAGDGETDHGYATVGQVVVAKNDREDGALVRLTERLSTVDDTPLARYLRPVRRLTGAAAGDLVPYLGDCVGAVLLPGIARVDGRRLRNCLESALRKRGATFRTGVGRVIAKDGAAVGVDVDGERLDSDQIIVASGAWSAGDWPGLRDAIAPDRGQLVHLSYRDGVGAIPVVSSVGGPYIVAFEPNRVVVGATHDDAGFDHRVTAGGVAEVLDAALRVAPGLADATILETRVGFRPVSRDRLPLLGSMPGLDGAVVATGLGAHGLTLGPAVGAIAARLAAGQPPGHDLTALRPDRFR